MGPVPMGECHVIQDGQSQNPHLLADIIYYDHQKGQLDSSMALGRRLLLFCQVLGQEKRSLGPLFWG